MNEVIRKMIDSCEENTDNSGLTLYKFAFVGKEEDFNKKIDKLAKMAEEENWTSPEGKENDILKNYLIYTFEKAIDEDLVMVSDDKEYAVFNTGLLTKNGEDIVCMFNRFKNSKKFPMHLQNFYKESDYDFLMQFSDTPQVVTYFENPEKIYFDPTKDLVKNLDHILEDNIKRFPEELQAKGKTYILSLLSSGLELTIKRCKRNYRIAVPQYYNKEITYLLPVDLDGTKMALAVGSVNNRYRVNTIFTLSMAYKNARLLMKPEADWLSID